MDRNNSPKLHETISVSLETGVRFYTSKDSGSYVPPHWHRALEIIYLQEGELSVTVGVATVNVTAGQCLLINSNAIHSTKCTKPNQAIVLQVPVEFIETYIPDIHQYIFVLHDPAKNPIQETKLSRFKETLFQMQVVYDIQPDGFLLRFNSLLFDLLFQLYHNFAYRISKTEQNRQNKNLERLNPVLDYISDNYARPISLEEISDIAGLQPNYFCRFFKKNMGITFLEYQNELRISHIFRDLIETNYPLYTILENHGFTNRKAFRRMFYEYFHTTPSKIRALR